MAIDRKYLGKVYGPFFYRLGLEKMREFASAVAGGVPTLGLMNPPASVDPLLYDEAAARAGPYGRVIAFPTFAVAFAMAPFGAALSDPLLGINLLRLVHGEQEFEFFDVMREGDLMRTTGTVSRLQEKAGMDFITVVSESFNQEDRLVVRGHWTGVVRAA